MGMLHDVRYAGRVLRASPGLVLTVSGSIAVGLAATLAIVGWLDALVYRPLSGVPRQDRIVVVDGRSPSGRDQRLSYPEVRALTDASSDVGGITAYTYQPFNVGLGDHAERVWGQLVTANFFELLQVAIARGRGFHRGEEAEGAGPVVVISDRFWRERFGGAADAIGRTLQLNGQRLGVIGIAPPGFHGVAVGLQLDVWVPVGMQPILSAGVPNRLHDRSSRWLGAYARLTPGATFSGLSGELNSVAAQLAASFPATNSGVSFTVNTLPDAPWGGTTVVRPVLRLLLALVLLLLAATCANVTSVLLARTAGRRREIASRLAVGASRYHIVRQLLAESVLLGGLAGCAAAAGMSSSARLFAALLPPTGFPIGFQMASDIRLIAIAAAVTLCVVLSISLLPALHAVRTAISTVLREEAGTLVPGGRSGALRHILIGAQIALSVALLVTSATLVKALSRVAAMDPGFETQHLLLASIDFAQGGHTPARALALIRRILDAANAERDIRSASVAQRVPLDFGGRGEMAATIDGYTPATGEEIVFAVNVVGPDYLRTMKIPLLAGREFTPDDDESSEPVAMVNARAAATYWRDATAMHRYLVIDGTRRRVIGIAADIRQDSLTRAVPAAVLIPVLQSYRPALVLHLSTRGDAASVAPAVRDIVRSVDASLALFDVRTMQQHLGVPAFPFRLGGTLSAALALFALLLTVIGLYGLTSHAVAIQRRELGVRIALGATKGDILRLVTRRALMVTLAGIGLGLAAAIGAGAVSARLVEGVQSSEWSVYAGAVTIVAVCCGLAAVLPLRRLTSMDPAAVFRAR